MNKKSIIILVISIIFFIVALSIFLYASFFNKNNNQDAEKQIVSDTIIDSFYIYDIENKKLNFSDFSEKPNVILLWKSDNSKSYEIINLFQKYYNDYKDSINFLAINVNEPDIDLDLIKNVKAAGFSIPIYFDKDLTLQNKFKYEKLPHLIFIEENGEIAKEFTETVKEDAFEANLDLLAGKY